jgi:cyclohexadienyl dehydratase
MPALRVATSADYAPFSSDRAGTLHGMDVDVAARLARDLGMRVEYVRVGWPQLAAATQQGGFDVAMSGVTMRPERALIGRYTRPYALVGSVALVRSDDAHTQSVDALDRADVRIAVNAGGHLERVARMRFPAASIEPVTDNQAVMQRLADGKADAVVTDTAELQEWTRPGVRALGPFSIDHKAYLLPADRGDLAARLDAWMVAREADGWLDAERVRWLGRAASMDPEAAGREAVVSLICLRLALMPDVAAAKQAAGVPIEDRAQEARVIERVRARSARPDATAAVYRQLIELAKAVQRGAPAAPSHASLDELRAALGRIDEQLVGELDRAPRGSPDEWRTSLARSLDDLPIDPTAVEDLVSVLTNRDAAT